MMMHAEKVKKQKKIRCIFFKMSGGVLGFIAFLVLVLFIALKVGINSSFLATKIQENFNLRLSDKAQITISNAYLLLDDHFHLSLESRDVGLQANSTNGQLNKIGYVRVTVALLPLLQGKLHIKQVRVRDVEVTLPSGQGGNFLSHLPHDDFGRVDFDALSHLVFNMLDKGMEVLTRQELNEVSLDEAQVNFFFRGKAKQLDLMNLTVVHNTKSLKVTGRMLFNEQEVSLEGRAAHDKEANTTSFDVKIAQIPLVLGAEEDALPYWEDGTVKNGHFRLTGLSDITLDGQRTASTQDINLKAILPQGKVEIADASGLPGSAALMLVHMLGQEGLQLVEGSQLTVDQVGVNLTGSLTPLKVFDPFLSSEKQEKLTDSEIIEHLTAQADSEGKYAFELLLDNASHPTGKEGLGFTIETKGNLETLSRQAVFNTINLRTVDLDIKGHGRLRFSPPEGGRLFIGSQTPEAIFNLETPRISLKELKQMWPFHIASAVRRWVFRQVKSGTLHHGQLQLNLPLDFYHQGKPRHLLSENELKISGELDDVTVDLIGDLPQINFQSLLDIKGQNVKLMQGRGAVFINENKSPPLPILLHDMAVDIIRPIAGASLADLRFKIVGEGADMLRLIRRKPINAGAKLPFTPEDFSGQIQALMQIKFPMVENEEKLNPDQIDWQGDIEFDDVDLTLPLDSGGKITGAHGKAQINNKNFSLKAQAKLDEMVANFEISGSPDNPSKRAEKITLIFDDTARKNLLPALSPFISGTALIEIGAEQAGARAFSVDLSQAIIEVPWLGWKKGAAIAAQAQFIAQIDKNNHKNIHLRDFSLKGTTFELIGEIEIVDGALSTAKLSRVRLNRDDDLRLDLQVEGERYLVKIRGTRFDMRSFIKSVGLTTSNSTMKMQAVDLELEIEHVSGFYDEVLEQFKAHFKQIRTGEEEATLSAKTMKAVPIQASLKRQGSNGQLRVQGADGGALLRFANTYDKVQGGELDIELQLDKNGAWHGPISLRDFEIVDDPRLARIVSSPPSTGGKSLNDVTGGKINASRLAFDRAFGQIVRGENFLMLDRGIVRGATVGATFQGVVYDSAGNISMTGTFMPAYGLNRVFSNVPLLGNILGNGRDRGLIGITFKMDGKAKNPRIIVNPLSVIAPGVFRQIFEFHP